MRFRNLLWKLIWLLCLFLHPGFSQQADSTFIRGLWIIRHNLTSPQKIDSFLQLAYRCHFSDLFIQVRGRGDAYYQSHLEPRGEDLPEGFDPLQYILQHPLRQYFNIHAWINVFYTWSRPHPPRSANHILQRFPQWLATPARAQLQQSEISSSNSHPQNIYISPLHPSVQNHILNVISDLLTHYKVDGLHLDYIRFPGPDYDFHPRLREQFQQRYLLDPLLLKTNPEAIIQKFTPKGYEFYSVRWARFLQKGLNNFVKKISQQVHQKFPGILLSAAVKANLARAHWEYFQEWDVWVQKGWLDFALPMNYTASDQKFRQRTEFILREVPPTTIVMGISLFNQTAPQVYQKMHIVQTYGLKGFCLFSLDQLRKNRVLQQFLIAYKP